ncbi:MAG: sulfotransferase family protein, partial [Mycobacterium sp.]|nr:sulfotransferase family protein [Mycobacterium sp.]
MHVIGVGFGRTGTASLRSALDRLGAGPCYHMSDVMRDPTRARAWLAASRSDHPDWDSLFAGS